MCLYKEIQVHLSYLHHGAAGHRSRAWSLRAPTQLDRVIHHHIPLEQDRGGHERVALHTETHELASVYILQRDKVRVGLQGKGNIHHCLWPQKKLQH